MAKSAVSSLIDLYNSISATHFGGTRPNIYLGEAAPVTSAGATQRPPFCVLYDDGFKPSYNSSAGGTELGTIRIEAFARDLDAASGVSVDSIVRGIRFGGSAPGVKAGFDWGTFSFENGSYLYKVHLKLVLERRSYAGFLDHESKRVHKAELRWECVVGLSPT